jgi:hypothetical protein
MDGTRSFVVALLLVGSWAAGANTPITDRGWGAVQVGMTSSTLKAEGFHFATGFTAADDCAYFESATVPDLRVMVEGGRVVRVETDHPTYSTAAGVRVGDALAKVRRAYSGLVKRPHQYVDDGEYLILYSSDHKRAVLIEVVERKVVQIRGGVVPPVEYVEGCS